MAEEKRTMKKYRIREGSIAYYTLGTLGMLAALLVFGSGEMVVETIVAMM